MIDTADFKAYFNYWLQIGSRNEDGKEGSGFQKALWKYIRKYGFENVPKLLKRYDVFIPYV